MKRGLFLIFLFLPFTLALADPAQPVVNEKATLVKILDGFKSPVAISFWPKRSKKIGVLEQSGRLFVVHRDSPKDKQLLFDLSTASGVRHPLDFAFHPEFSKNGRIFISCFLETSYGIDLVISEFEKLSSNKKILSDSESEIIRLKQDKINTRVAPLLFDSTGALLVGLSDGAAPFDPKGNGQNIKNLYGSIVRLNVEDSYNYVPSLDNPYVMSDKGKRELYAFGLRDPSSLILDSKNNNIYIGDRGGSAFEEINLLKPAANYGWPIFEGTRCLKMRFECSNYKSISPLFKYSHKTASQILLGGVFRSEKNLSWDEAIIFAALDKNQIWALKKNDSNKLKAEKVFDTKMSISSFAQDSQGEIYLADEAKGEIFHIALPAN